MNDAVTTENRKFICLECKNENELQPETKVGDIFECSACGIEYEVINFDDNDYTLQIIEEEK